MFLSVLALVLTALAVHCAPSGTKPERSNDDYGGWMVEPKCNLAEDMGDFMSFVIRSSAFEEAIPTNVSQAYEALDHLLNLEKKSGDFCSPANEKELTNALEIAKGAYAFIAKQKNGTKKDKALKILVQNWDFLPQMVGKAARLIERDSYCFLPYCAMVQMVDTIYNLANDGSISRMSVEEVVTRVENLAKRKCSDKEIDVEESFCPWPISGTF